jgi:hypothetical protein
MAASAPGVKLLEAIVSPPLSPAERTSAVVGIRATPRGGKEEKVYSASIANDR